MTVADQRVKTDFRPSIHTVPRPEPVPRSGADDVPTRWRDDHGVEPLPHRHLRPPAGEAPPLQEPAPTDGRLPPDDHEIVALLRQALRRSRRDGKAMTPADGVLLDVVVEGVRYLLMHAPEPAARAMAALSPREREIARMVSLGHTNKTIADVLEISLWTVSTHLRRIFAKLNVSTRAAMIGVLSGNPELLSPLPVSEHDSGGSVYSS
jgi:DNA-binding CsgD family transcriptional regulator